VKSKRVVTEFRACNAHCHFRCFQKYDTSSEPTAVNEAANPVVNDVE